MSEYFFKKVIYLHMILTYKCKFIFMISLSRIKNIKKSISNQIIIKRFKSRAAYLLSVFQYGRNRSLFYKGIIENKNIGHSTDRSVHLLSFVSNYNSIVKRSFPYDQSDVDFCSTEKGNITDNVVKTYISIESCNNFEYVLYVYYAFSCVFILVSITLVDIYLLRFVKSQNK